MPVNNQRIKDNEFERSEISSTSAILTMSDPVVVSFSRPYRAVAGWLSAGDIGQRLSRALTEVAVTLREDGILIGHIKTLITFPGGSGSLGISVVKDTAKWKEIDFDAQSKVSTFKAAVTAIVYGCSQSELGRLVKLGLALGLPKNIYEEEGKEPASIISLSSILNSCRTISRGN